MGELKSENSAYETLPLLARGNVFNVAPGQAFLHTLANALVNGELIQDFKPIDDPLSLSDATIYLPTRRSARGFAAELLNCMQERTKSTALLLPKIRTIGDLDEEEILLGLVSDMPTDIGKVINPQRRQLILARLTKHWSEALNDDQRNLFNAEDIVLPSSAADAIRLASNVASFMDQIETEEVSWQTLETINDDNFQQWWQITLSFLKIIMEQWPEYLHISGEINPAEFRRRHTEYRINQLSHIAKSGPVIAAGSTGSIPATARLIAEIAKLPNGAVVLPGLDQNPPEGFFDTITKGHEEIGENIYSTHPQFGLCRLVGKLETTPGDVTRLGNSPKHLSCRESVINYTLLPSEKCTDWSDIRHRLDDDEISRAFENVSLVNAAGERQEALAIAILFRQLLEQPGKSAALITPDRNLARRVASELERYGIYIDDSGGSPLALVPQALFFKQLLKCVFEPLDPIIYSSFLKNRYLLAGHDPAKARHLGELLELLLIRDAIKLPALGELEEATRHAIEALDEKKHAPRILKNLDEEARAELIAFAAQISKSCACLCELSTNISSSDGSGGALHLDVILAQASNAVLALNKNPDEGDLEGSYFYSPTGEVFEKFIRSYQEIECHDFELNNYDVVPVIEALLGEIRVRNSERNHPRLHVYGPLEARLQSSDLIILGGLNEGTWPQIGGNDPFLNRPMRAELGLPLPERRIGLSAHDFQQFMSNEHVVLTRSNRVDDAPSVASRWVQRLTTFLGKTQAEAITKRGDKTLYLVDQLDHVDGPPIEIAPPAPTPPVEARPNSLSITEIETWIRDPYAIYAKHVLGLYPLPPLVRNTDAAIKGTLYHDIVADFVAEWSGPISIKAHERFFEIADARFEELALAQEVKSVWRPRFDSIARDFLSYETERHGTIETDHTEIDVHDGEGARAEIDGTGFYLRGRADRISLMKDGSIEVLDYKTGTSPSGKMARSLVPQLSLEGALAQKGLFKNVSPASAGKLAYIRLRENAFKEDDISTKTQPVDMIITDAWENLKSQIIAYQDQSQPYVSRFAPRSEAQKSDDYDHLARVREWSLDEDSEALDG